MIEPLELTMFERRRKIYKGDIYKLYEIIDTKTNIIYIAKTMAINSSEISRAEIISFHQEINLLSKLNHPAILKFIGYNLVNFKKEPIPVLITELLPSNTLKQIIEIENNNNQYSGWNNTKKLINIYGIASAMLYLHSHNIIHRNLNPESILLDDDFHPKLSGFKYSREISNRKSSQLKGIPAYIAPEIFLNLEYSKSSDVYAFSILIHEILTNKKPFKIFNKETESFQKSYQKDFIIEIDESIPPKFRELIEKCSSKDPTKRPSFEEIIQMLQTN